MKETNSEMGVFDGQEDTVRDILKALRSGALNATMTWYLAHRLQMSIWEECPECYAQNELGVECSCLTADEYE
jgi:hypothetical protein